MSSPPRRFPRDKRLPGIFGMVAGALALVLFLAARTRPELAESLYGRTIYPVIARVLASVSGGIGVSLAEWVFVAIALSLLFVFPAAYGRARRRTWSIGRSLLAGAMSFVGLAGAWWAAFVLLWGLNYARPVPVEPFGLGEGPDGDRARALIAEVSGRLDKERGLIQEDEQGVALAPADMKELDAHLRELQAEVLREAGLRPVAAGRAKKFALSPLLLRWGVSGVYGPFTGEPNIAYPAPPALLPVTLAHERAHLSGFAPEETASFIAFLTCWRSPRPEVRYAAWFDLWLDFRHEPAERSPGVKRDVAALAEFMKEHRGPEARHVWRAYGGYLKAHGVKGGLRSYDRAAGLALRWIEAKGMPPEPETVRTTR